MRTSYLLACALIGCATLPPPPPVPLPTTTPEQLGKLTVLESMQSEADGATTMRLQYLNDTSTALAKVRLECVLIDHVGRAVNSDNLEIETVAQGAAVTKTLTVRDVHSRAERAECRIGGAKPTGLRADR